MNTHDNEQLLREYYQSELAYLRKSGAEFAQKHPRIAAQLELTEDVSPDPFTERLIESFAWLAGRIRYSVDARLPQISTALLGALYPNFTAPIPSLGIVEFQPDAKRSELADGAIIPAGTMLGCNAFDESQHAGDELAIKWKTAWPVTIYPIRIVRADFQPANQYHFSGTGRSAISVLRLGLASDSVPLQNCNLKTLRIFLKGDRLETYKVYEKVLLHKLGIELDNPDDDWKKIAIPLHSEALRPAGLLPEELVLPKGQHAIPAYQLLQEYLAFPERFLFWDIEINLQKHIAPLTQDCPLNRLDVLIPLAIDSQGLFISPDMFRLHATPALNLFAKISEPVDLNETKSEYRLLGDARRNASTEIHSIETVSVIDPERGDTVPLEPFFTPRNTEPEKPENAKSYWVMERTPASGGIPGTDVWLRFVDSEFRVNRVKSRTAFARLLCTNRHFAAEAPAGIRLECETEIPCSAVFLIAKPTLSQTPAMGGRSLWMLISHLSLNYLSLEGENGAAALREILRLYVQPEDTAMQRQLQGLKDIHIKPIVRRMGNVPWRGFANGIGIELTLDESFFNGSSAYLFAEVMNTFFRMYADLNTPTEMTWKNTTSEEPYKLWKPNFGIRPKI
ncbi:MAG: type VI secretion system baseplate subunit TssF [Planctomycetaceae bacterium]|nr:type VI secretion system baseplate subunit TssF [Planctomycetaceae bacterium]